MALSQVEDADTFDEPEEDDDASREACFACEEAYEQLSTSDKEEKKQREAQHWKTYQAIPLKDYWNWLSRKPKKPESSQLRGCRPTSPRGPTETIPILLLLNFCPKQNPNLLLFEFMFYYCDRKVCNKWLTKRKFSKKEEVINDPWFNEPFGQEINNNK